MKQALLLFALGACLASAGLCASELREISGRHITLVTDVPSAGEVDALAGYFDQAFDQWCNYFGVAPEAHADWRIRGHLIRSREPFQAAGLLAADLPPFTTGYARGHELWLYDQTSDYYRRHLLLHEGTHAFMETLLGGIGPPWYAEGTAELLATHRVDDGKLTLNYFPASREEVSKWGRIEIVERGVAAGKFMPLSKIFAYGSSAHLENEPYGWCWAAAAFFDGHPRYRSRFRSLKQLIGAPDFTERARALLGEDTARLSADWQLFVAGLDYGYDFRRMETELTAGKPLAAPRASLRVAADRGWQSSGIQLRPGKKYELRASGRYVVGRGDKPWVSEPQGVTIRYYRGQPLGVLLAAVRSDEPPGDKLGGLANPIVVGRGSVLEVAQAGTLFLRINDAPGQLHDNSGRVSVEVASE